MKSVWVASYQENEIRVVNTWFSGEKLYVNNKLQDEKVSLLSSDLSGHIVGLNGERKNIKVNLSGRFRIDCRIFVDDEKVEIKQTK